MGFASEEAGAELLYGDVAPAIKLGPPAKQDLGAIIDTVISEVKTKKGDAITPELLTHKHYEDILKGKRVNLWNEANEAVHDIEPRTEAGRLTVFSSIQPSLPDNKIGEIRNVLLQNTLKGKEGDGFKYNGTRLFVSAMRISQEFSNELLRTSIRLTVRLTDYFSYRTIAACSPIILGALGHSLIGRDNLRDYLHDDNGEFQEFIHLIGVVILVKTSDNFLFVRRRSGEAADTIDARKLYASAVGGLSEADIDYTASPPKLKNLKSIADRVLEEEIFSENKELLKQTEYRHLTGVLLYRPNVGLNLCLLVQTKCSMKDVLAVAERAVHGWEFQAQKPHRYPEFSREDVERFCRETIGDGNANKEWDEGSLVAMLLATRVLE